MSGRAPSVIGVAVTARRPGQTIATVTVNNPAKLNTLGSAGWVALAEAFESIAGCNTLVGAVLTGAGGRAFIGGADINEMAELGKASARVFIERIHRCCRAIRQVPVPVIARMQGYTLGAGLEIAAACDIRVAAEDAVFGMPEVRIGIPSVVEAALLPMLIGWGRTRELLLFGQTIDARRAAEWGLVERLAAAPTLDAMVDGYLDALLDCGPQAIRSQKALIRAWEDLPVAAAVEAGVAAFERAWDTNEPRDRMAAFLAANRARRA